VPKFGVLSFQLHYSWFCFCIILTVHKAEIEPCDYSCHTTDWNVRPKKDLTRICSCCSKQFFIFCVFNKISVWRETVTVHCYIEVNKGMEKVIHPQLLLLWTQSLSRITKRKQSLQETSKHGHKWYPMDIHVYFKPTKKDTQITDLWPILGHSDTTMKFGVVLLILPAITQDDTE
jgi:hypothetical protein